MDKKKAIVLAVAVAAAIAAAVFKVDVTSILTSAASIEKQITPLVAEEEKTAQ